MVVWLGVTVTEPEVPLTVKPELVQEVALVELQESVAALPCVRDAGDAVSVAVGTIGAGETFVR